MKTALAVIDVQSYFMQKTPSDLPVRIAEHIYHTKYNCIAFTIFHNPDGSNYERSLQWNQCKSEKDLLLADALRPFLTKDNLFKKPHYSAFKSPGFEEYLRRHQIEKIVLCGVDTDACILATAYEAFDKNYAVNILFDLSHSRAQLQEAARSIALRNICTKN